MQRLLAAVVHSQFFLQNVRQELLYLEVRRTSCFRAWMIFHLHSFLPLHPPLTQTILSCSCPASSRSARKKWTNTNGRSVGVSLDTRTSLEQFFSNRSVYFQAIQ
jgi:hypothetical protein